MPAALDRTGLTYGELKVIAKTTKRHGSNIVWRCRCSACGKASNVSGALIQRGHCGCKNYPDRHGHGNARKVRSPEYIVWNNMVQRCTNPNREDYERYGGRGITVCKRWRESFMAFYEDMGKRPKGLSLDRKNNDGNYHKRNCRWATKTEQANNKRNNRKV